LHHPEKIRAVDSPQKLVAEIKRKVITRTFS